MSESSGPSVDDVMNAESVADITPANDAVEETAEPEVAEVAEPEAPTTQEVVQNVQEMLSSNPEPVPAVLSDKQRLEKLEDRVEELVKILRSAYKQVDEDNDKYSWVSDWNKVREDLNNA